MYVYSSKLIFLGILEEGLTYVKNHPNTRTLPEPERFVDVQELSEPELTNWNEDELFDIYNIEENKISRNQKPQSKKPKVELNESSYTFLCYAGTCVFYSNGKVIYMQRGEEVYLRSDVEFKDDAQQFVLAIIGCSILSQKTDDIKPSTIVKGDIPKGYHKVTVEIPDKPEMKFLKEVLASTIRYLRAWPKIIVSSAEESKV